VSLTISITEDDVMAALRSFILDIVPTGVEVFQGQANRVPEPRGVDFIVMTPMMRLRLSTNTVEWDRADDDATELEHSHDTQFMVQLDLHGPAGSDYATTIATMIYDDYAVVAMEGTGVAPLYATDGNQVPFKNAEQQWENRWVMTVALQIVPIVSTPQQFAATLTPVIVPALGGIIA
jgi:hypothetical protein